MGEVHPLLVRPIKPIGMYVLGHVLDERLDSCIRSSALRSLQSNVVVRNSRHSMTATIYEDRALVPCRAVNSANWNGVRPVADTTCSAP